MRIWGGSFIAAMGALVLSTAALGQELAAEVYPGAQKDPVGGDAQSVAFYSQDPVESVLAFYGLDGEALSQAYSRGAYAETFDRDRIIAIQTEAGWKFHEAGNAGASAGVRISAEAPPSEQQKAVACGGTNGVLNMMATQYQNWGHSKEEAAAVCAKYEHLATAVYMMSDKQDGAGRPVDQGKAIEEEFVGKVEDGTKTGVADQQEIARKMQEAMAKGDMQEVQRLSKQLSGAAKQTQTQDHWNAGVNALERMDAIDYRTRIVINTHPATWQKPE